MRSILNETSSFRGSFIAHAWLYGGGLVGVAVALAILISVPVTGELGAGVLGVGGTIAGLFVGGWIGIEHEDRYERRRLGMGAE